MRHFIFALMIVLLPLRSWMGDAMAYSMVYPTGVQSIEATSSALPCHGADAATDTPAMQAPAANACTACQACHSTASLPQPLPAMVQVRSSAPVAQPPALWASADLSVLTKPPVL